MLFYAGNGATEVITRNAMELTGANLSFRSHPFALLDLETFIFLYGVLFSLKFLVILCDFHKKNSPRHDCRTDAPCK
jgi:hypothetical protein